MISTTIRVEDKKGEIKAVFAAESQALLNDRASYTVKQDGEFAVIAVSAQDASALRAVLNSICKLLIVFEKANEVAQNV